MGQAKKFSPKPRGSFIDGEFHYEFDATGEWVDRSPADFSDELGTIRYSYASVDQAVRAARTALDFWKKRSLSQRVECLRKCQELLLKRRDEIAEIIAREVGKPLWESEAEVSAMAKKVEVTITDGLSCVQDYELPRADGERAIGVCRHRPVGVLAVIGPFNFPGHLPMGHIVPALLTGNTIVFKPSERAPLVGQLIAECFEAGGIPHGVFNLIQGDREVGRRLCVHDKVDGVLFTGSYEVGARIKQDTLQQHWKLLVLEMGGKNPAIIWEDANLEVAVHETLVGAFITAGQRCSATSRILVHERVADEFLTKFHEKAKCFRIGHPLENPFMGPLIEPGAVDRYMKFLGIAAREGCEIVMRGKALDVGPEGCYVTPSICLVKNTSLDASRKSVYQQNEIFAPNVAVLGVSSLEEAVAQANCTQYGLVASVFTQDREIYAKCLDDLQMGLVNWNKSTVGASSRLPFGGRKKSGNYFPTAAAAARYCVTPVSSLEIPEPGEISLMPGLN